MDIKICKHVNDNHIKEIEVFEVDKNMYIIHLYLKEKFYKTYHTTYHSKDNSYNGLAIHNINDLEKELCYVYFPDEINDRHFEVLHVEHLRYELCIHYIFVDNIEGDSEIHKKLDINIIEDVD